MDEPLGECSNRSVRPYLSARPGSIPFSLTLFKFPPSVLALTPAVYLNWLLNTCHAQGLMPGGFHHLQFSIHSLEVCSALQVHKGLGKTLRGDEGCMAAHWQRCYLNLKPNSELLFLFLHLSFSNGVHRHMLGFHDFATNNLKECVYLDSEKY